MVEEGSQRREGGQNATGGKIGSAEALRPWHTNKVDTVTNALTTRPVTKKRRMKILFSP